MGTIERMIEEVGSDLLLVVLLQKAGGSVEFTECEVLEAFDLMHDASGRYGRVTLPRCP